MFWLAIVVHLAVVDAAFVRAANIGVLVSMGRKNRAVPGSTWTPKGACI